MTEKMNQLMKDVPAIRWTALILLASAMFFGYIFMDILSPLQELLQTSRGWSPDAYGHYAGSETFLNVFVFFLIFAGIILDKMGVRFTAILYLWNGGTSPRFTRACLRQLKCRLSVSCSSVVA